MTRPLALIFEGIQVDMCQSVNLKQIFCLICEDSRFLCDPAGARGWLRKCTILAEH